MKPRIRVWRGGSWWWAWCPDHGLVGPLASTWHSAMEAANRHVHADHTRADIASFLALRDDHPASDRRWETPLPHDLEPPC